MSRISKEQLLSQGEHYVGRTERGDLLVRSDPRQLPRRLRVLLLAVDGGQTVKLYTQSLKGFGDVGELLIELLDLGLVELIHPDHDMLSYFAASQMEDISGEASGFRPSKSNAMTSASAQDNHPSMSALLDDARFQGDSASDLLFGATTPGGLEELQRVAQIPTKKAAPAAPKISPKPAAPAPVASTPVASIAPAKPIIAPASQNMPPVSAPVPITAQNQQIESLFSMLDATRAERVKLKQQLAQLEGIQNAGKTIYAENRKLRIIAVTLGCLCAALAAVLLYLLLKR